MKPLHLIALAAVLALAACSPGPKSASSAAPAAASGLTPIKFATDWHAQAEQGGFYQALATGEYSKRGLEVTIVQGGPSVNVPQLLASGAVDLGMGSNSFIVLNLAQEKAPVKAVAAFMQKDPQVLIAHPGQGIKSIADMKGHPILLSDASVTAFWVWLKSKYHFTDGQVRKYTFNSAPFLADKRVIQQGYATSEPFEVAREGGFRPNVFLLADYGYDSYSTLIETRRDLIDKNPDLVQRFVDASIVGWMNYIYGDNAKANALIRRDNPDISADLLAYSVAKMRELGIVDSGDAQKLGVGAMTGPRIRSFFAKMAAAGLFKSDLAYADAYTLQFVGKGVGIDLRRRQ